MFKVLTAKYVVIYCKTQNPNYACVSVLPPKAQTVNALNTIVSYYKLARVYQRQAFAFHKEGPNRYFMYVST